MKAVLHCAGPFSRTAAPMADACLRAHVHYLDITGEIEVFEGMAARHEAAQRAGVTLLPGAGFDVVPSDCLAAHLHRRLPSATHLALGFQGSARLSRGTATTMVENLHRGGAVRRDGRIARVPAAWKTRVIDFGAGPVAAITIPWGDVATAYHTTGIPNVEVYMAAPASTRRFLKLAAPVRAAAGHGARAGLPQAPHPSADRPAPARSTAPARACASGARPVTRARSSSRALETPEGYELTSRTALLARAPRPRRAAWPPASRRRAARSGPTSSWPWRARRAGMTRPALCRMEGDLAPRPPRRRRRPERPGHGHRRPPGRARPTRSWRRARSSTPSSTSRAT